jgi:hypothetical protein
LNYAIAKELAKTYHIRYWVRQRGNLPPSKVEFPDVISQTSKEALRALVPAEIDASAIEPAGGEVFEALRECEAVVYSMMDRFDFENTPFRKRRQVYFELVNYWNSIFSMMKPDAIAFDAVPHSVYDYVIYSLARYLDIKTVIIDYANVPTRYITLTDFKKESNALLREMSKIREDIRIEDLTPQVRQFYLRTVSGDAFVSLLRTKHMAEGRDREFVRHMYIPSLRNVISSFRKGEAPRKFVHYIKKMLFLKSNLMALDKDYRGLWYEIKLRMWERERDAYRREYESLVEPVDWKKKFLFVALQYQPEATTCPAGGIFNDQILMLRLLSCAIPEDWMLYVKEHPVQWAPARKDAHLGRYRGYYKQIASLGKVRLISSNIQPDKLIDRCQGIATVTGTVALEAILRGKPSLVFGYKYQGCSEIFHVSGLASCRAAIKRIREGYKPDSQNTLKYLAALDRASIKEWEEGKDGRPYPSNLPGAAERVAQKIIEELDFGYMQ